MFLLIHDGKLFLNLKNPGSYLFICFFKAHPGAYGGSQARGRIGATAAGLHHSSRQCQILNPPARPGIETETSWFLVGFVSTEPRWELPKVIFKLKKNLFPPFREDLLCGYLFFSRKRFIAGACKENGWLVTPTNPEIPCFCGDGGSQKRQRLPFALVCRLVTSAQGRQTEDVSVHVSQANDTSIFPLFSDTLQRACASPALAAVGGVGPGLSGALLPSCPAPQPARRVPEGAGFSEPHVLLSRPTWGHESLRCGDHTQGAYCAPGAA